MKKSELQQIIKEEIKKVKKVLIRTLFKLKRIYNLYIKGNIILQL